MEVGGGKREEDGDAGFVTDCCAAVNLPCFLLTTHKLMKINHSHSRSSPAPLYIKAQI